MSIDYRIKHMLIGMAIGILTVVIFLWWFPKINSLWWILPTTLVALIVELCQEFKWPPWVKIFKEHEEQNWMQAAADIGNWTLGSYIVSIFTVAAIQVLGWL